MVLALFLVSCVSSEIKNNNKNLKNLEKGMSKADVLKIMGNPLVHETYNSDNIWFYYTDKQWADTARTRDECTPLVFKDERLIGWGKEFYYDNYRFTKFNLELSDAPPE